MADVNWRRVFIVSSFLFALLLICGSIYLHLKQEHHLGRLRHDDNVAPILGVDTTPDVAIALPVANNDLKMEEQMLYLVNQTYKGYENYDYKSDEDSDYSYDSISLESHNTENIIAPHTGLEEQMLSEDFRNYDSQQNGMISHDKHMINMSEACLQCICETTTECKLSMCSNNNNNQPCGIFRISRPYWIDAGELRLEDEKRNTAGDSADMGYSLCVNNAFCAARTVYAFVDKYARDCNRDGFIDCRDHIALHILGPTGCMKNELSPLFNGRMERCLAKIAHRK